MSTFDTRALTDLVRTALEQTAFLFVEPLEEDAAGVAFQAGVCSQIRFTGGRTGTVRLLATEGFARQLTAGILSTEPREIEQGQAADAIREMANIIAGLVIRAVGGGGQPIHLDLPVLTASCTSGSPPGGAVVCDMDLEGERLRVVYEGDVQSARAAA